MQMTVLWLSLFMMVSGCKNASVEQEDNTYSSPPINETEQDEIATDTGSIYKTPEQPVNTGEDTSVRPSTIPRPEDSITEDIIENVELSDDKSLKVPDHGQWDRLLRSHVTQDGKVDYAAMNKKVAELDSYIQMLSQTDYETLSRNQALAFWINAYNAFTVKLILDHWPVASIMDIHGGTPWDVKWIKMDGKNLSLNNIEHDIIRSEYNEPRVHFAVNCAARSCPPLLNKAWTAENLEKELENQTRAFINNKRYNSVSRDQLQLSKIFEWYKEDFGDLAEFIDKYSPVNVSENPEIIYKEYDWSLNN